MRYVKLLMLASTVVSGAAIDTPDRYQRCIGFQQPIPFHHRQHQGIILATSHMEYLGPSFQAWQRKLVETSWRVAPFDDGYMDDGQPFEFVTTLPLDSELERYRPMRTIDVSDGSREEWLKNLRDSRVMLMTRTQGNELYLADAHCAGVPVILLVDPDATASSSRQWYIPGPVEPPVTIIYLRIDNVDILVDAVDQVMMTS